MLQIFIYGLLSSIHIYICGYIFHKIFINQKYSFENNLFELAIYGAFVLSFIALILNFFISLDKITNDLIFLIPFFIFLIFFFNKILIFKIIIYSIPISLMFLFTLSYDNTYRPDAGLYHLPYISILNDSKIIIGINNIHFRFGHTSILQYLSSIYNNHLFDIKGINIPSCLIFSNFIGYIIFEIFNKKNNQKLKFFIILIFIFIMFRINRYSDFGNDASAHLLFFYLIIETLKNNDQFLKIKNTVIASTFIFLNKITLLLCFLIPLFLIFRNLSKKKIITKTNIFAIIFLSIFIFKNILVSGCAIFPLENSCIKNLYWYDNKTNLNSNAANAKIENEAWTKGWINQNEIKDFKSFSSNFNWIKTWKESELKRIVKKLSPFLTFLSLFLIFLIINEFRKKKLLHVNLKIDKEYYFLLFVCFAGVLLWFLKFPVFRYGYSYLVCTLSIILTIFFGNYDSVSNQIKFKKISLFLVIFLFFGTTVKNSIRIYNGVILNNNPWPNIYNGGKKHVKKKVKPIIKNKKIIFYASQNGECYYNNSPCTHYYQTKDFKLEKINLRYLYGYKVYYFTN